MIKEFSFKAKHQCYLAVCDDPKETIKETAKKYWESHGINKDSYGSFIFYRNEKDEMIGFTACTKIDIQVVEYIISCFDTILGERCTIQDLIRITEDFSVYKEKYEKALSIMEDLYKDSSIGQKEKVLIKSAFPEIEDKNSSRIRKTIISYLKEYVDKGYENAVECIDWLKEQETSK